MNYQDQLKQMMNAGKGGGTFAPVLRPKSPWKAVGRPVPSDPPMVRRDILWGIQKGPIQSVRGNPSVAFSFGLVALKKQLGEGHPVFKELDKFPSLINDTSAQTTFLCHWLIDGEIVPWDMSWGAYNAFTAECEVLEEAARSQGKPSPNILDPEGGVLFVLSLDNKRGPGKQWSIRCTDPAPAPLTLPDWESQLQDLNRLAEAPVVSDEEILEVLVAQHGPTVAGWDLTLDGQAIKTVQDVIALGQAAFKERRSKRAAGKAAKDAPGAPEPATLFTAPEGV